MLIVKKFFIFAVTASLILSGCSEKSEPEDDSTKESTSLNDPTSSDPASGDPTQTETTGKIKFKLSGAKSTAGKTLTAYSYEASGSLVATANSLSGAIDTAKLVQSANVVDLGNDEFEIVGISPTNNAAVNFVSDDGTDGLALSEITVDAGQTKDLGELSLEPTTSLQFRVNSAASQDIKVDFNTLNIHETITTNEDVSIANIPQGRQFFTVSNSSGEVIVTRYVEVGPDHDPIVIDLADTFEGSLSGKVEDSAGNALADATVYLKTEQESYLIALTDASGNYEFNHLSAGDFTLIAQKDDYKSKTVQNVLVSGTDPDVSVDTITLESDSTLGAISGYAYFEGSQEHAGMDITLEKVGGGYETNQLGTLKDGAFLVTGLPVGKYILNFGKSTDSLYSQEVSSEIEVIAGVTHVLEKPIVLKRQLVTLSGTITIPSEFGDLSNLKLEVVDADGNVLASAAVIGSSYTINDVPKGSDYTLRLTGTDADGNTVLPSTYAIETLTEDTTVSTALTVEYSDPNPPVISSITFDSSLKTDSNGNILVLPTLYGTDASGNTYLINNSYINFEVTATDVDGDEVTYLLPEVSESGGEIVQQNGNKFTWKAPEAGGSATITFKVKSNNRTVSETKTVKINHAPAISVTSPSETYLKDDSSITTIGTYDLATVVLSVTDYEDGALSDNNVSWYSTLQGDLGNGTTLKQNLVPGKHKLTVTAVDAEGLTAQKELYLQVEIPENIELKANGATLIQNYFGGDGTPLATTYDLGINNTDLTLNYNSSNSSVMTVSDTGTITSGVTGMAYVNIISDELNSDDTPVFESKVAVKVIDKVENTDTAAVELHPNETYNVLIDNRFSSTASMVFNLNNLSIGDYEILLYDGKSDDASYDTIYYKVERDNGDGTWASLSGTYSDSPFIYEKLTVSSGNNYRLRIYPYTSSHQKEIKVSLLPGTNVKDSGTGEYLNITSWDNSYEPNDVIGVTSYPLEYGISYHAKADLYDKLDTYSIEVESGKSYTVNLYNDESSTSDATLYVYDKDDASIKYISYLGEGKTSFVTFTATYTGKYYVKVYPYTSGKTIVYDVMVTNETRDGLAHDEITYEPNDGLQSGYIVEYGQRYTSLIGSGDRYDSFIVSTASGKSYGASVYNAGTSTADLVLKIYDRDDNLIANANTSGYDLEPGETTYLEFESAYDGDYYVQVYGYTDGQSAKFELVVTNESRDGLVHDEVTYEPNDNEKSGYIVEYGQRYTSYIGSGDQFDSFIVSTASGKSYGASVYNAGTSTADLVLKIYDKDYNLIANANTSGYDLEPGETTYLEFESAYDGDYYVQVYGYTDGQSAKFELVVTNESRDGLVHDEVTYEPNDNLKSGYIVEYGQRYTSYIGSGDQYDSFIVSTTTGSSYTASAYNFSTSTTDLVMKIFDKDDNLISYTNTSGYDLDPGETTSLTFESAYDGDYYIQVYGYTDGQSAKFEFEVSE